MRRRLIAVALATTSLVALAFAIPLGLLVRNVARDRALSAAERDMAALAPVLALTTDPALISAALARTGTGASSRLTVWTGDTPIGDAAPADPDHLALARERRLAFSAEAPDGVVLYQPVVTGEGEVAVVRAQIPKEELTSGVGTAWAALAGVAAVLVLGAVVIADQLGRTVTGPARDLAAVARRLGHGDLDLRAATEGPAEIAEVGSALNFLARRIQELLASERERVADLSHRLRTPLTALRLDAEAAGAPSLIRGVDRVEHAISDLITEARRPLRSDTPPGCDLVEVVQSRTEFWGALAEEQGRPWSCHIETDGLQPVPVPPKEAVAALDGLLGNVFTHTPEGTAYRVTLERRRDQIVVAVEDAGSGIDDPAVVLQRGHSEGGSTGLGLDIARRTAEAAGGHLDIDRSALGGARIGLSLPLARS